MGITYRQEKVVYGGRFQGIAFRFAAKYALLEDFLVSDGLMFGEDILTELNYDDDIEFAGNLFEVTSKSEKIELAHLYSDESCVLEIQKFEFVMILQEFIETNRKFSEEE